MATFTFRVPERWVGKIDSKSVQLWLNEYLKNPVVLPPDPGAGKLRISISLPDPTLKIIRRVKEGSISGALRRIVSRRLDKTLEAKSDNSLGQQPPPRTSVPRNPQVPSEDSHRREDYVGLDSGTAENRLSFGPVRYVMGIGFPRASPTADSRAALQKDESTTPSIPPLAILIFAITIVAIFAWLVSGRGSPTRTLVTLV
jgi:hypothetical protein